MKRALLSGAGLLAMALTPVASAAAVSGPAPQQQSSATRWGPLVVPPATDGRPGDLNIIVPAVPPPCTNCFLTGAQFDLVFSDGRTANLDDGLMLHHLIVFNAARPDSTCPPDTLVGSQGERFLMAYNERTAIDFPPGFGYRIGTERVGAAVAVMNSADRSQIVEVVGRFSWVPDPAPDMRSVRPIWLDENNCRSSAYPVSAGPSHKIWRWTSTMTGRVVAAGGHLHNGGVKIVLANETTGQRLCTSYASYGTRAGYQGGLDSVSRCVWDRLGTVRAGEVLSIDAYYDPPEGQPDVMGIVLAYVYETDDLEGGTAPPPEDPPPPWPPAAGVPSGHHHHEHAERSVRAGTAPRPVARPE